MKNPASKSTSRSSSLRLLLTAIKKKKKSTTCKEILTLISRVGDNINDRSSDANGYAPLHEVQVKLHGSPGDTKILKLFLKAKKVNVNVEDNQGLTPLDHALEGGENSYEACKSLIDVGADVNTESLRSLAGLNEILRLSVINNDATIVEYLLSRGVNVNTKIDGRTLLQIATIKPHQGADFPKDTIGVLLKNGADVNVQDEDGQTPLHHLVKKSNASTVELLLRCLPDVNIKNKYGEISLVEAVRSENVEMVQMLLDYGSDVNATIGNGDTLLYFSAGRYGNFNIFKCLLKNGADANALDPRGEIPLMTLMLESSIKCKRTLYYLLKYSDLNVITNDGRNIFDIYIRDDNFKRSIVEKIAKLQAVNIPVNPYVLDSISKKYSHHFPKCVEELTLAKKTKLEKSWVTFFNLLVDDRYKLQNYARNSTLVKDFKKGAINVEKFRIYGKTMKKNMSKGIKRRKLFDKSSGTLSNHCPIFGPTHLIVRNLLECLSTKDLSKFCELKCK